MQPALTNDDLWVRRGISLVWDADELNKICKPNQVMSLRQFCRLDAEGWSGDDLPLINDRTLIVAGLEACIDALPPNEATDWLEQRIYPAIVGYQREVADGGGHSALVLWIVEHQRLRYRMSDDAWYWYCAGEHRKQQIPLGQCLFNGAQSDLREIHNAKGQTLGLYHPRIS